MEAKVQRDVQRVAADTAWTKLIVPDEAELDVVAGTVALWPHDADGECITEIGWMALPEFQGRGLAKQDVRTLLELARVDGRWRLIHAFPALSGSARRTPSRAGPAAPPGSPREAKRLPAFRVWGVFRA
ncbi:GNAT family N-acetyltransferase [Streptomyces sp. f51]|uniref:GNAT family N-acetyltransferase n=1 Tax=Streptomyces sp. f51 TaxID=1827742 RepID=UPI0035A05CE2